MRMKNFKLTDLSDGLVEIEADQCRIVESASHYTDCIVEHLEDLSDLSKRTTLFERHNGVFTVPEGVQLPAAFKKMIKECEKK